MSGTTDTLSPSAILSTSATTTDLVITLPDVPGNVSYSLAAQLLTVSDIAQSGSTLTLTIPNSITIS